MCKIVFAKDCRAWFYLLVLHLYFSEAILIYFSNVTAM